MKEIHTPLVWFALLSFSIHATFESISFSYTLLVDIKMVTWGYIVISVIFLVLAIITACDFIPKNTLKE